MYHISSSFLGEGVNVVCMCVFNYSILVYGSVDTAAQCLLTFQNPEGCPVLCLTHTDNFLFAGLTNGKVTVYGKKIAGKNLLERYI